jgi:hypothetical protein
VSGPDSLSLAARLRGARFNATHQEASPSGANRIRYGVGGDKAALLLAARLKETVEMLPDPSLSGNQIRLELTTQPPSVMVGYRAIEPPQPVAAPMTETIPPPPRTIGICG